MVNISACMEKEIAVFAPASVTNVGCGFDIMGFAIHGPGDEIRLRLKDEPGIVINKITGDSGKLPYEVCKNTAGVSLKLLVEHIGLEAGIELEIHKKMAIGSGLGSSAASAVASVFALNELLGRPLSRTELLRFALKGEDLTCGGSPHADNVAACLMGGFTVVRSLEHLDIVSVDVPDDLLCAIVHPHFEINTADTRKVLKSEIPLTDVVRQMGNIAGLIIGLRNSDFDLIGRSMNDYISEPSRSLLIPGFAEIKKAITLNGALSCNIAGSGPSVFAFCRNSHSAENTAGEIQRIFAKLDINSDAYVTKINNKGPEVIN